MGSYSLSQSSTSYTNTPLTLDNNENGVALAGNRDTQLGGIGNIAGSSNSGNTNSSGSNNRTDNSRLTNSGSFTNNTLDGGAIGRAFDFGEDVVAVLASLTRQNNEQTSAANAAALDFGSQTTTNTAAGAAAAGDAENAGIKKYLTTKNLLILAGVGAAWFLFKRGK